MVYKVVRKKNKIDYTDQTLGSMAAIYQMNRKTFNKNIENIRPELDKMAGRKRYSRLSALQVKLIIAQMGTP